MARETFTLSRADIQMSFESWLKELKAEKPYRVLGSPAYYTDTFINHLADKHKL